MEGITALLLNTLKSKTIGAPAAEEDSALFRSFVFSDAYKDFENGSAFVAIGARGSGKSAIFRKVAEEKKKAGGIVVEIKPEHYSYEMLSQILKSELEGSWAKQAAYSVAWQYVLLVTAIRSVVATFDGGRKGHAGRLRDFLLEKFANQSSDPKDILISYLKRIEKVKIAGNEIQVKELNSLYKLEGVHNLLPQLKECLNSRNIHIFVDELDRGWDGSEDARYFVAGIFQAAIEINRIHPNMRVYVSLRQELYDNIPSIYEDAQKIRHAIRYIRWTEEELRKLAEQRLAVAFSDINWKPPSDWWSCVFEDVLKYRSAKSFNYVVDRTTYRPREIILFLNECVTSHTNIATKIDYDTISNAEFIYSQGRTADIAAEFRFGHPGLNEIFESFRGHNYQLTRDDLVVQCIEIITSNSTRYIEAQPWCGHQDEENLIRVLWSVGFLKAYLVGAVKGNVRPGSQYVGFHQIPSSAIDLERIKNFHVHPMFRSYLGMREKKGSDQ